MKDNDLVIRGGTVVDGTGGPPFLADVAVKSGRIVGIGADLGTARSEIDASQCLVTPGFVDIHTHYDGQIIWEQRLFPSSAHGVTTVVTGNCGVGFAPCRAQDRDRLIKLMEGIEDIPEIVLTEGLAWDWQTFPEYMRIVERRRYDVDVALQIPHSALRVYVMGERAVEREAATPDDIVTMARLASEAIAVGAIGFGTSRTINHRASDGKMVPTLTAAERELSAIAMALSDSNAGVLQLVSDFTSSADPEEEFDMLRRIVRASGRPLSFTLQQKHSCPNAWRRFLDLLSAAQADGLPITAQVLGRPSGLLLGYELTLNPFSACSSYQKVAKLPFEQRISELRKPEVRARILSEEPADNQLSSSARNFGMMFKLDETPDYEPFLSTSILAQARRSGIRAEELAYDLLLENDGRRILFCPSQNYADGSLESSLTMMKHPHTIFGLGDGGAHYGLICDASIPTFMLSYWTRDRIRGEKVSVPWIIRRLCHDTAAAMGLNDRGVIRTGYRADLNVIDYRKLRLQTPEVVYDLPAGGRRINQRADGYVATLVNGEVTYRNGIATGNLPGRVVQGPQSAPCT